MVQDDDFDLDDDIFGDEDTSSNKVSIKQLWQDNPVFKIVVIVVAIIALYVVWSVFFNEDDTQLNQSRVNQASDITSVPGEGESSPAFQDAVREADRQRAEEAAANQESFTPTQIGSNNARINAPNPFEAGSDNPLDTWRVNSDAVDLTENNPVPQDPLATEEELAPVLEPYEAPPLTPAQAQVQPQAPQVQVPQVNPDMVGRFAEQMRVIMGSRQPEAANLLTTSYPSPYRQYLDEQAELEASYQTAQNNALQDPMLNDPTTNDEAASIGAEDNEVILSAGTVSYAQVINALNSDLNGPVLAHILSGPFAGGRAIGSFQLEDDYLVLTFNRIVKDEKVYGATAYALDSDTTLTGVRSDVNRHWIKRVLLPAAAEFIAGVGEAIAESNETTVVVDGGAAVTNSPELDTGEEIAAGVERGADRLSNIIDQEASRSQVTVTLEKGTPIGMLFTESIYEGDAQ
tara:strand:- start:634 stop:2013 length:1380 start_codon:yes stop_codon:yes gene_type:complete